MDTNKSDLLGLLERVVDVVVVMMKKNEAVDNNHHTITTTTTACNTHIRALQESNKDNGIHMEIQPQQPPITDITTEDMNLQIDRVFLLLQSPITEIRHIDSSFAYGRKIHVITNSMEVISNETNESSPKKELIKGELKNMFAGMTGMIQIAINYKELERYKSYFDQLIHNTSDLFECLTGCPITPDLSEILAGNTIPPSEEDSTMIDSITPFMQILTEIYDSRVKTMGDVCTERQRMFKELYEKFNKGENKSIETKKVYLDAVRGLINGKSADYKLKIVSEFIIPLLTIWIKDILLVSFSKNDNDQNVGTQINELCNTLQRERSIWRDSGKTQNCLNEIRARISPTYKSLKETSTTGKITIEQFETRVVVSPTFDIVFGRLLMRDTMELEAIEL